MAIQDRNPTHGKSADPAAETPPVRLAIGLSPEVESALQFQVYDAQPRIHGVHLHALRKHRSANGWFAELLRVGNDGVAQMVDPDIEPFAVRQISTSFAAPGRINAFHLHPKRGQDELWTVMHGQLLVWLVDCRRNSPTEGAKFRLVLSGEEPAQLRIPAGVAHGYQAGPEGATLLYVMDQQFDTSDPDEGRLPWDFWGAALWEEDRG